MSTRYVVNEATIPVLYQEHPMVKSFLRLIHGHICYTDFGDISFDVHTDYVYGGNAYLTEVESVRAGRLLSGLIKRNMVSIVFKYQFDSGGDCYEEFCEEPDDFTQYLSAVPSLVLREVLALRQE